MNAPLSTKKKDLNILLIGNSFCYYWPDELWGLMNAAGYENVTICNVYYSGCTFEMHWNWHLAGEANYAFCINDKNGRREEKPKDLEYCVNYRDWDVISLLQSGIYYRKGGEQSYREHLETDLPPLYNYLKEKHPNAHFLWQQSWAYELGKEETDTLETQQAYTELLYKFAQELRKQYSFTVAPCGNAWQLIRHHPLFHEGGRNLTTRIFLNKPNFDDLYHDGCVGGGQYLNACVFFETLTGQSCIGNPFRPIYVYKDIYNSNMTPIDLSLSEEKIVLLQNAAHQAVANAYGEDYAK
jgi:hypothetical protein